MAEPWGITMKANNFKHAHIPKKRVAKSRIENGRCVQTDKIPYYKKKAEARAARLSEDERGVWSAYKCPFGTSHWHIGHSPKPLDNYTNQEWLDTVNGLVPTDSEATTDSSNSPTEATQERKEV